MQPLLNNMISMQELLEHMKASEVLHSPAIIDAFTKIDRKYFVPEEFRDHIYIDAPLPIGKDQTISQPSTVAFMLELLAVKKGDSILDVGSGSGWTTALLCTLAGKRGSVRGVERVDALVERGQHNLAKFNFGKNCHIEKAGERLGIPEEVFDKILVSASAAEIPKGLLDQLKIGGVMVIPIKNSIFKFTKISKTYIEQEEFPGFVFVPLIEKKFDL